MVFVHSGNSSFSAPACPLKESLQFPSKQILGFCILWIKDPLRILQLVVLIYLCHSQFIMTQLEEMEEVQDIYFLLVNFLLTVYVRRDKYVPHEESISKQTLKNSFSS